MSLTFKASAKWKHVSLMFGVATLLKGVHFAVAKVTLTASPEPVAENSPLTLTCTYKGNRAVYVFFEMSIRNHVKILLLSDCSEILLEPNKTLYDYNCNSNKQFEWTIKNVTRGNEGDTWKCEVFLYESPESATYTISVHDTREKTSARPTTTETSSVTSNTKGSSARPTTTETSSVTSNTKEAVGRIDVVYSCNNVQSDNTAIIVGITLGVFSFVVAVYAAVVTVLLKRKTTIKDILPLDKSTRPNTYVNSTYVRSNVTTEQGRIHSGNNEDPERDEEDSDKHYTSLNLSTRDANAAYDSAKHYTSLNLSTRDANAAYDVIQTQ